MTAVKYGAGVHQWDVPITEVESFVRVSSHSGQKSKSNVVTGGLHCGGSILTNPRNG